MKVDLRKFRIQLADKVNPRKLREQLIADLTAKGLETQFVAASLENPKVGIAQTPDESKLDIVCTKTVVEELSKYSSVESVCAYAPYDGMSLGGGRYPRGTHHIFH